MQQNSNQTIDKDALFSVNPTSNERKMTFDLKPLDLHNWMRNHNHLVLGGPATKEG